MADAHEAAAELEGVTEVNREHFEALQIQMQDMKRQKTVDDFALVTATRLAVSLKTAHELALDARATTAGLNAAVAAPEARKTWEATATLQADAQHALLVAPRNETALASERAHEMELQNHKMELDTMI